LATPNTQELLRVVTTAAVGAPGFAFPLPVAPIAPDPFVPDVSTPLKLTTVIEAATLWEIVAFTVTLDSFFGAKARQISAVPSCTFVRRTKTHVSPAPLTPVTVTLADLASVAMNASSNSFAEVVENDGDVMLVLELDESVDTLISVAIEPHAGMAARRKSRLARTQRQRNTRPVRSAAAAGEIITAFPPTSARLADHCSRQM
jgi:hypothetical protein